ncbi:MAG: GspH/FimT family pseudopilin [Pseudomonadales bacterium]|nr:GspH/FimT family pseudopilin [Pseudomonadales bacterium]
MPSSTQNQGFTLIELMVTVAVAIILLTVGVPSLLYMISSSAITGNVDALNGDLALARSEAIVEKTTATVCKSADLLDCDSAVSWSDGWIVFTDVDGDQAVDGEDTIIRVHEALSAQVTLKYDDASVADAYLQYSYKGDLESSAGTFTFCPSDNDVSLARAIIVATTGRVRRSTDSDADGVHEDGGGGALTCP